MGNFYYIENVPYFLEQSLGIYFLPSIYKSGDTYVYMGAHIIVESFVHLKQNVHNTTYAFKFAGK